MSASGLTFAQRGGQLISRSGRGKVSERERTSLSARYAPSVREAFPVLRDRLLASRPVIEPAKTVEVKRGRRVIERREVPAVFGKPTFRNVFEDGVHR